MEKTERVKKAKEKKIAELRELARDRTYWFERGKEEGRQQLQNEIKNLLNLEV